MPWFALQPTAESFFDDPQRNLSQFGFTAYSPAAPEIVWAELHSARPLHWCSSIRTCQWAEGSPSGVGSHRTVSLAPGVTVRERYFLWEEGPDRLENAFTVDECSVPGLQHFGERYRVTPTTSGSRFDWAFYIEPKLPQSIQRVARNATASTVARLARDTRRHLAELPGNASRA